MQLPQWAGNQMAGRVLLAALWTSSGRAKIRYVMMEGSTDRLGNIAGYCRAARAVCLLAKCHRCDVDAVVNVLRAVYRYEEQS